MFVYVTCDEGRWQGWGAWNMCCVFSDFNPASCRRDHASAINCMDELHIYISSVTRKSRSHLENKTKETFSITTLHVGLPHCLDLHMGSLHIPLYIAMTATVSVSPSELGFWIISTVSLPRACIYIREQVKFKYKILHSTLEVCRFNPFRSYVGPCPTVWFSCSAPMSEDVWHGFCCVCSPTVRACLMLFLMQYGL
jgi:hypothetical protein